MTYLDIVEQAVSAYSGERILNYIRSVEEGGLAEHGFPRLTANLGMLVAHGRATPRQRESFMRMMDLCCDEFPTAHARNGFRVGNDFSVKEIVLCLLAVESAKAVDARAIARWRAALSSLRAEDCYSCIPEPDDPVAHNWAVFAAASEQMRIFAGVGGDASFVERQIAGQMKFFDANGMYRDPNEPMVYDFVTRLQFAVALRHGYDGPSRAALEAQLLRSAGPTLRMQSATGEIPFGGRSNQFLHNDTFYAALCEFYAMWFASRGDAVTARRFECAAARAVLELGTWTAAGELRHVKNRFPLETRHGCEGYGYFDKYMVTMGSWAILADDFRRARRGAERVDSPELAAQCEPDGVFETSPHFHKVFLDACGYTLEFDTNADVHYDASGLGRVQRRGALPTICISVPYPAGAPAYEIGRENPASLAIQPGWRSGAEWVFADGPAYTRAGDDAENAVRFAIARPGRPPLCWRCSVDERGVTLALDTADGSAEELAMAFPAFAFDGETESEIVIDAHTCTVSRPQNAGRCSCRYETSGEIIDTGATCANRNGLGRRMEARGPSPLTLRIAIRTLQAP